MHKTLAKDQHEHVLLVTLDSCRVDTFQRASTFHLNQVGPSLCTGAQLFHLRQQSAMWMGFTQGNPQTTMAQSKAGKLMRMANVACGYDADGIQLSGPNISRDSADLAIDDRQRAGLV